MNSRNLFVASVLLIGLNSSLAAQSDDLTLPGPAFSTFEDELPNPTADKTAATEPVVVGEQDWFTPPPVPRSGTWNVQLDFIPTTSQITNGWFGVWTDDPSLATRLTVGFENPSGFGMRGQSWAMSQKLRGNFGTVNTDATTFYVDAYQQQCLKDMELSLGGGFALAHMDFASSRYIGVGASVLGDGFYPLRRYGTTDFGLTGRARLALLASLEDDILNDWGGAIDELGWGLRLRRRFGRELDNYWTIDIAREVQHWGAISEPFDTDEVFHGTALKFGIGW